MGQPNATVYVDYKGTPHTFLKLDDGNGNVKYYGFAPKEQGSMWGLGVVGEGITTHAQGDPNNSKAGYIDDVSWSKTIPVTSGQYTDMKNAVDAWQNNQHEYNVFNTFGGTNCTGFVEYVMQAGNVGYPGISSGPNPMDLIPVNEQGPLFTVDPSTGARNLSDAVRDPLNTLGTPAYEYKQAHPELFSSSSNASSDNTLLGYDLVQNPDGSCSEIRRYSISNLQVLQ